MLYEVITCSAPVVDRREVTSSNGETELRYVIETEVQMGDRRWPIQLTLTNRENMMYRMLFGRGAMQPDMVVDPNESRITSYNVCYTKLLRTKNLVARSQRVFTRPSARATCHCTRLPARSRWRRNRITSYNVCYTKLLR